MGVLLVSTLPGSPAVASDGPLDLSVVQIAPTGVWSAVADQWRLDYQLNLEGIAGFDTAWRTELRDDSGAVLLTPSAGASSILWTSRQSGNLTTRWCGVLPAVSEPDGLAWAEHQPTTLTGTVFFPPTGQQVAVTTAIDLSACPGGVAQTPVADPGPTATHGVVVGLSGNLRTKGRRFWLDVDPDLRSGKWKVIVERATNSGWRKHGRTRYTKGTRDTLTAMLKPGTYRLRIPTQRGVTGWTSPELPLR